MAYELDETPPVGQAAKQRHPSWRLQARAVLRDVSILMIAVLLGRAQIVHNIAPFALAYFVVVHEVGGKRQRLLAWFALVGALSQGGVSDMATLAVQFAVYQGLHLTVFKRRSLDIHWLPFLGGLVDLVVRLAVVGTVWTQYDILMSISDAALVTILALVFIQSIPLVLGRERARTLRNEELMSLTILVGSILSGLSGLTVHGVSIMLVMVDWSVIVLASAGGAGIGAAAAITLGILTTLTGGSALAAIAVLGFSGLLAGVMKEARRPLTAVAFLLSYMLLSAGIHANWSTAWPTWVAAAIAAIAFMVTPRSMRTELATFMPGTMEHQISEQERVRRIRRILSERIQDLGHVFDELSQTFAATSESKLVSTQQLLDHTVSSAAAKVCQGCALHSKCWEKEGYATYQSIVRTVERLEESPPHSNVLPTPDLKDRCIRIDAMMSSLRQHLEITDRDAKWMEKLREQRGLVSAQLGGVAQMIQSVAKELERGNEWSLSGEEQILSALEQLGLYVDHVHIVSLDPGKVEVEVTQPSKGAYEHSVRMIAPLLSGVVGEHITVQQDGELPDSGSCTNVFTSAPLFEVKTAVSTAARDGKTVSGDSYTNVDLGNGRFAVVVSDGMGNGERARKESKAAVELLKKLMKAGFDEQLAIQTVNSTLLLRSRDEIFTTLDMALIDMYSAQASLLKVGSAPSFVRRANFVKSISGDNVPIGILRDIEVQSIQEQFRDGDLLILMSDGVYDAPSQTYDKEDWLRRQITRLETEDPQEIADTLIEAAVRLNHGEIRDDMTVVVARIQSREPEWASIKLPGVTGIRKRKRGA